MSRGLCPWFWEVGLGEDSAAEMIHTDHKAEKGCCYVEEGEGISSRENRRAKRTHPLACGVFEKSRKDLMKVKLDRCGPEGSEP